MSNERAEILRFGTFEADLRAGELRKQGKRSKVQDQPFQVLTVLLQRPGDVVTREGLRSQIWPEDTFVDFDNSLNTAINKLREALGDCADNPRFIETLPRRGYRFIAPMISDHQGKSAASLARWKIAVAGATVAVLAAGVLNAWLWRSRQTRRLTDKDTLVLGDFANSTADAVFDGTLREGLSVQLEQSPFLSLLSEEGIHQTLRMMGQPANARLTPEITREICQRTNSTAALGGSIAMIGARYDLILKGINCASGDLLASAEAQANDKSHVLDALGKAASDMRSKLGESLSSVQKYNTPLDQATTPSLEALQALTLAENAELPAALPLLQRAIELDPNFAIAYAALSDSYVIRGESDLAAECARKAYELRGRVSQREKLLIEDEYAYTVTGNNFGAQSVVELGTRTYPRDPGFHGSAGGIARDFGQYEAGLKEHLEALRLDPHDPFQHRRVVSTYLSLSQVEKAEAAAKEAQSRGLDSDLPPVLYQDKLLTLLSAPGIRETRPSIPLYLRWGGHLR